tara:strand:+ start:1849 stop:2055 length:207 start_codon:yes stop_codon:yes gene_type:complete
MEILSISAIIISVIAALGAFVKETHIQKCKGCCIESDCRQPKSRSPSNTPIETQPKREIHNNINISEV